MKELEPYQEEIPTLTSHPAKDKQGKVITNDVGLTERWVQPTTPRHTLAVELMKVDIMSHSPPQKVEIIKAIKMAKSGKAQRVYWQRHLNQNPKTSAELLHLLLGNICEQV